MAEEHMDPDAYQRLLMEYYKVLRKDPSHTFVQHFFEVHHNGHARIFDLLELPEQVTSVAECLVGDMVPLVKPAHPPKWCGLYTHVIYAVIFAPPEGAITKFALANGLDLDRKLQTTRSIWEGREFIKREVVPRLRRSWASS